MATSNTTRHSTRSRAALCALLAISLGWPLARDGAIAGDRRQTPQIATLAGPAQGVQVNRDGPRFENLKHRSASDSPFLLHLSDQRTADKARWFTTIQLVRPLSFFAVRPQSGRSPPLFLS